jgi:D-cysteine desulfhydrase
MAIPRGGATALGTAGFVRAAHELSEQLAAAGHDEARIVLAVGSGASIAGLLVGAGRMAGPWTVTGVSVSRALPALVPHVDRLVDGSARLLGLPRPPPSAVHLLEAPGGLHGSAQPGHRDAGAAAFLALETEGLLLDPDYTAPAFGVALRQLTEEGPPVVFWHTGGLASAISSYLAASARESGGGS